MSSCVTQKQRDKICATCQHTDSVRTVRKDTIIYKDSIAFLTIQGDSIVIPCPDSKPFDIVKKHNGIKTEIKGNGKTVECICSDDSLKLVIQKIRADHFAEIDSMKDEKFLIQCDKKHVNAWYRFCNIFTIITLSLCVGAIIAFGIRLYLKK